VGVPGGSDEASWELDTGNPHVWFDLVELLELLELREE
jgi:hypothetical protein